jgi:protein-L-isoaspartate(D-aspartate) O-methyltransferase
MARSRAAAALFATSARADVTTPFAADLWPDMSGRESFVAWMKAHRGEEPLYLGQRWDRYLQLIGHADVWDAADERAFLMTPREEFVRTVNLSRAYEWHHLNIGFGVAITGPRAVARMTNTLAVRPGDKALEIGTGSGYQSAYLSCLTDKLWTIEIQPPFAKRTRLLYDALISRGYSEYRAITTKTADGYYGWEDAAPFDKIIVTRGIDHIPAPLLQQLAPGGIMVIPVGSPGAQHVIKATKTKGADGVFGDVRSDIHGGAIIPFVPFTGGHQGA